MIDPSDDSPVMLPVQVSVESISVIVNQIGHAVIHPVPDWSEISLMIGGSLTGFTVRRNAPLVSKLPSDTTTVILDVPNAFH